MAGSSAPTARFRDEDLQVSTQLRDVESRLVSYYAAQHRHSPERVRHAVATNRDRFAHARVRTFVPILVERAARAELEG